MHQEVSINETFQFFTDAATLAVYDPATIPNRIHDEVDWWCGDFSDLQEFQVGLIALLALSNDGFYKIRVTNGSLTQDEKDFSRSVFGPLGCNRNQEKFLSVKGNDCRRRRISFTGKLIRK